MRPNALTEENMSDPRFVHVGPDGTLKRLATLDELLGAVQGGGYAWLDFFDPSREDLFPLVDRLGVHPLSVEDCLDENQVPKFEEFPANTFILVNGHRMQDGVLVQQEVDLILGKNAARDVYPLIEAWIDRHEPETAADPVPADMR